MKKIVKAVKAGALTMEFNRASYLVTASKTKTAMHFGTIASIGKRQQKSEKENDKPTSN